MLIEKETLMLVKKIAEICETDIETFVHQAIITQAWIKQQELNGKTFYISGDTESDVSAVTFPMPKRK